MPNPEYTLDDLSAWNRTGTHLAVIGHPIKHSISPQMHNAALTAASEVDPRYKDWSYHRFDIAPEALSEALDAFRGCGFKGLNLTVPHKVDACQLVASIDPEAGPMGAVNTILLKPDGYHGYNTDGFGLRKGVSEAFDGLGSTPFWGRKVVLLGAGGAARSAAFEIVRTECKQLFIGNRSQQRRDALLDTLDSQRAIGFDITKPPHEVYDADILINATSLGLNDADDAPIALDGFRSDLLVYDMIYNPAQTALLKQASDKGMATANGLGMLVWQGARALSIWMGVDKLDGQRAEAFLAQHMRSAAEAALAGEEVG